MPLISYDIKTGPNEIIQHNINGFLIESGNKSAFIEASLQLIDNQLLRTKMSESSIRLCNQFDVDAIINQWERVLFTVVGGRYEKS